MLHYHKKSLLANAPADVIVASINHSLARSSCWVQAVLKGMGVDFSLAPGAKVGYQTQPVGRTAYEVSAPVR